MSFFNWKIPFYRNIRNILEWKLKLKQYYNGTNYPQSHSIYTNKSEDARSIRSPSFPIARHSKSSLIFRLFYQAISTLRSSSATEVNRKIVTHRKSYLSFAYCLLIIFDNSLWSDNLKLSFISIRWIRTHFVHFLYSFPFGCLFSVKCEAALKSTFWMHNKIYICLFW
jgi:hypothetical protein